jgi:hypothetical protein
LRDAPAREREENLLLEDVDLRPLAAEAQPGARLVPSVPQLALHAQEALLRGAAGGVSGRSGGGMQRGPQGPATREGGGECTVGTWVGATVGRGPDLRRGDVEFFAERHKLRVEEGLRPRAPLSGGWGVGGAAGAGGTSTKWLQGEGRARPATAGTAAGSAVGARCGGRGVSD